MKKQTVFGIIFVAALLVFSMVITPPVFAEYQLKITIVNNSNQAVQPTNNPHKAVYGPVSGTTCPAMPADACGDKVFTVPSSIAANSSYTVNVAAPHGCNLSMWQTYYKAGNAGNLGLIKCVKSGMSVCSTADKNFTCTISQQNVNDSLNRTDSNPGVL